MPRLIPLTVLGLSLMLSAQSFAADIDWSKVDTALGKTAAVQGEVHRYGIPRSDLKVTLDGIAIKPALALGGWVAFEPAKDGTMLMGDIVLTENEVTPVMTKLLQSENRDHGPSQPPHARDARDLLHACPRPR